MEVGTGKSVAKLVKPWPLKLKCYKHHDHGANAPYGINNPGPLEPEITWDRFDDIHETKDKKGDGLGERLLK